MPESQQSSRGQEHQDLSLVTNTLRLCLALKQSPTLRRQLQSISSSPRLLVSVADGGCGVRVFLAS